MKNERGIITLDSKSEQIQYLTGRDKRFAKVFSMVGPITYEPYEDCYDYLVAQIIGQMLSNKVADVIYKRLEQLCGGAITPKVISALTDDEIKSIGTSRSKVSYIRSLTEAVTSGALDFTALPDMDDKTVIKTLTAVRGIGMWSAKMYLIFVLNRQDVLPYEDVAFLQGYGWAYKTADFSREAVEKKCKKWKPYSSIAARYMYRALDMGLTKEEFHLYK